MRLLDVYWRRTAARVVKWLGYGAAAGCVGVILLGDPAAQAQRERKGGKGQGNAGARVQGSGSVRVPTVQGQPRGNAEVRVPRSGGEVRLPEVRGPGATVRVPEAGGEVRVPGAGAEVRVPGAGGQVRVPGAGAEVRTPGAGADVRVPGAGAEVRVPGTGGQVRVPGAGADVRIPGAGADVRVPGAGADVRTGEGRTALRPNLDADVRGGARLDGSASARVPGGVRIDPSVASQANVRIRPSWADMSRADRQRLDQFRASLNTAMRGDVRRDTDGRDRDFRDRDGRGDRNDWFDRNPDRARYWNDWGQQARTGFRYGGDPFFNYNWWNSRSLIGIGLGRYGYGMGAGYGGWWGYQPWLGYRPWWYWYGRPGWGSLVGWFSGYGWNQPYYYDYGPGGNVVYASNQVLVNSQPVGTPVEYAQSAAELAAVDPAMIGQTRPEDWMALGTFTLSTAKDESDPARVVQLAVNKEGLISGTSFNKETGKTYTVQGRVDKDTQRAAFTIGNVTDLVLETGLFNLTQEETPILAHLGANRTTTYLLARLPEPQHEAEEPRVAEAPAPALP